jgi:putative C-S lyase
MNLDRKLNTLPLTKSNPDTLISLFDSNKLTPMWVADMEFEIDKSIQKALIKRISDSGFAYEYKPKSFFTAQKKWCQDHYNIQLVKDQVVYSPSITTSISIIIENFTSKSDGIIIQPPVFMEFREVIQNTNRRIIKNPLLFENGPYKIDFEDLEKKAQQKENKILILCNPHNPVGRVWRKEELKKIIGICKKHNTLLISDEIHKDITLFGNKFTSILNYTDKWDKIIVCTSEAKTFNLCGISDSMIIIPNKEILSSVKDTFKKYNLGRTNALTRIALETAYTKGDNWLNNLIKTIENNVFLIAEELIKSKSKIKLIKPEGTYQVWLDFREVFNDTKEMFHQITEKSGIGINAGHWFGREGALFMRMNIATTGEKVKKSMQQIIRASL